MEYYRSTWAEIDLSQFKANIRALQAHIGSHKQILAVVKANAYGHGAIPMAAAAVSAGAAYLGVSSIDEGVELRDGGITAPILVLGYSAPHHAADIVRYNLTQTVFSDQLLVELSQAAQAAGTTAKIHVKLDTGMGRIGFVDLDAAHRFLQRAAAAPGIELEGIFTHLATSEDENFDYAYTQYEKWAKFCKRIKEAGIEIPFQHISNSGAGIQHLGMESSFVRTGLSMYGLYPAPHLREKLSTLKPALRLVSQIVHLQRHPAGSKISYGSTYTTKEGALIATLPIGYADGFSRRLSNQGHALVRGVRAPIAGTICMDQLMLDVSDIENVAVGDEVVLYGEQGSECITVDEVAEKIGTISYEVLCALGRRVPRVYLEEGQVKEIRKW